MGCCSSKQQYFDEGYGEPPAAPESPTWKLPAYPAPALPPLTRQNKVIVAASRVLADPMELEKTKRHVLNGQGEALSIVFDDAEQNEFFLPEVRKLFNLALMITSIELHTASLDMEVDFLQGFLDTLPSHGELRAFSLVTARDCPLVFSSISGLLYRNPNLQALRLWGVDLTPAGSGNTFYPACRLVRVDLCCCNMLPQQLDTILGASKETLLCLKFDKPKGLAGSHIARAVNTYGKNVQMLTIILPDQSESEMDQKASFLVGDTSSRFPKSLKFLHFGGLAASDNLFNVTPAVDASAKVGEPPKTHLSQLVALRLDQCPRVTVNGLFGALRQRSLPSMLRLHVYWLDNKEGLADIELWKIFAAGENVRIDTEAEGLIHLTAMKESAGPAASQALTTQPQAVPAAQQGPAYLIRGSPVAAPMPALMQAASARPVMAGSSPYATQAALYGSNVMPQQHLAPPQPVHRGSGRSSRSSRRRSTASSDSSGSSDSDDEVRSHDRNRRRRPDAPSVRSGKSARTGRSHSPRPRYR